MAKTGWGKRSPTFLGLTLPTGSELFFLTVTVLVGFFSYFVKNKSEETTSLCYDGNGSWIGKGTPPSADARSIMLQSTAVLSALRFIIRALGRPLSHFMIKDNYSNPTAREIGRLKFCSSLVKFPYFVFATIWDLYMLRGQPYVGPELGGTGSAVEMFNGWPCNQQFPEHTTLFYMVQMSYHLHSLIFHVFQSGRNDYFEMLCHHLTAIVLIDLSYQMNFVIIGFLVLFVHDAPDVFIYACKLFVDMKHGEMPTILCYVGGMLGVFGYLRLYVYPVHILMSILESREKYAPDTDASVFHAYLGLLTVLFLMHIYWYALFFKMGFNLLNKGKAQDLQERRPRLFQEGKRRSSRKANTQSRIGIM